jgi:hypothetical protein
MNGDALAIAKLKQQQLNDATMLAVQHVSAVTCPDHQDCPASCTCCPTNAVADNFACCSEGVNAVCCGDYVHCCPAGFMCDLEKSLCIHPHSHAIKKALASFSFQVICPNNSGQCPNNNTCCPVKGGFGCCPAGPNAVCCADQKYCCEEGYVCTKPGLCVRKDPAGGLLSAPQIKMEFEEVVEI